MRAQGFSRRAVAAIAFLCLSAASLAQAANSWNPVGEVAGGRIWSITTVGPHQVWAAADAGLFTSSDDGKHWTQAFATDGSAISISSSGPENLYATYQDGSVTVFIASTDGGANWYRPDSSPNGFNGRDFWHIAADPTNPKIAYAVALFEGVLKTTDAGHTWKGAVDGLLPQIGLTPAFLDIAVTGGGTAYVAVALGGEGVYQTTNGGAGWIQVLSGVTVQSVSIAPNDPTHVYANTTTGIYLSTDSGVTWNLIPGSPQSAMSVRIDPNDEQHIFAATFDQGMFETPDGGTTWHSISLGGSSVNSFQSLAIDQSSGNHIYAGSSFLGLYSSADDGGHWAESDTGLHSFVALSMAMGADGALYMASGGSGIVKSTDQGVSWKRADTGIIEDTNGSDLYVSDIKVDPETASTLYAAASTGFFRSTDGGAHWAQQNTTAPDNFIFCVAVDSKLPGTVYQGTADGFVYKSTDHGVHWSASKVPSNDEVFELAVDDTDSNRLYAGTQSHGVYRSLDGGITWHADNTGMPASGVEGLAVDAGTVYAIIQSKGLYKSTNKGTSWQASSAGPDPTAFYHGIVTVPGDPDRLYIPSVAAGDPAWVSTDAGATWKTTTSNLGNNVEIIAMAVDPQHPDVTYGEGSDGQVYVNDFQASTPPPPPVVHSSGGGGFELFSIFTLAGFAARRRIARKI